ncbi:hypothetical protein BDV59DRAFT_69615 [Aspergillus ambiguus]|uniref:uncharacterized protein n=1 Tax=Aspergillus ambiguus TaxID=176160 RepID=UPI003CCCE6B8
MVILDTAVKRLAAGIGLASESITAYNTKRHKKNTESTPDNDATEACENTDHNVSEEDDPAQGQLEMEWELDEVQDELITGPTPNGIVSAGETMADQTDLAELFLHRHHSPPVHTSPGSLRLPYPVVIPQRRPKSRKRGFIRAYAPVLEDIGISQTAFIDFLETANASCQGSPWLHAINLASIGTFFIPSSTSIAVSIMISIATGVALRADGRRKSNIFFDRINEEFFRPRGLYCLVMTWKPELSGTIASFDLNSAIATCKEHDGSRMPKKMKRLFRSSDGKTCGELPFPETAPLLFPDLEELGSHRNEMGASMNKIKGRREFVEDYWDRRSRAKFIDENPQCDLNIAPIPEFTSRYANPTHRASSGSLLGFVTGGYVTGEELRQLRENTRRGPGFPRPTPGPLGRLASVVTARVDGTGRMTGGTRSPQCPDGGAREENNRDGSTLDLRERGSEGREGPLRASRKSPVAAGIQKLLQSDVLYLMIVNMPSEDEMAAARNSLQSE